MRFAPALALALALALTCGGLAGCGRRRSGEPEGAVVTSVAPTPVDRTPVDRTLADELAEGKEQAFGLTLPRRMNVTGRFEGAIYASGAVSAAEVANYVRQRVVAERVETGPAKTVFSKAASKADPGKQMHIEVIARGFETQLVVRDETPTPVKSGLSDEERWRAAGLKPDGTPIDTKTFE